MGKVKIYTASPFWTRYEIQVKRRMIEKVRSAKFEQGEVEILDPEKSGNLSVSDFENKYQFAKAIFDNNIRDINSCDYLVFPRFTNDLGTLYEIGRAMASGKKILRYDFLSDTLTDLGNQTLTVEQYEDQDLISIDIDNTHKAVLFGYLSAIHPAEKMVYSLKGNLDNLMLSAEYNYKSPTGELITPENRVWDGIR